MKVRGEVPQRGWGGDQEEPDLPAPTKEVRVTKVQLASGHIGEESELVAVEEPLDIFLNGELAATIFSTPGMRTEHVAGYLLDEGIVSSLAEIEDIRIAGGKARVRLTSDPSARIAAASVYKVVTTACGLWNPDFVRLLDRVDRPKVDSTYTVRVEDLRRMLGQFRRGDTLWKATGGVHSASIYEDGELVGHGEDVGRHNAVDKAVGQAAMAGADFSRCVSFSTGRQPADMVLKLARVGVPIVVSNTSVLYSGIHAAEKTGATLVGFARDSRMNVYTGHERIIWEADAKKQRRR